MTRQGPPSAFAKTVYHLELSKTAGAFLAETRHVSTDCTGLVYSLGSLVQAAREQGPVSPLLAVCYVSITDTQGIIATEESKGARVGEKNPRP